MIKCKHCPTESSASTAHVVNWQHREVVSEERGTTRVPVPSQGHDRQGFAGVHARRCFSGTAPVATLMCTQRHSGREVDGRWERRRRAVHRCACPVPLLRTPQHNGVEGEVLEFDASVGRWRVQDPDKLVLALKASNLEVFSATGRDGLRRRRRNPLACALARAQRHARMPSSTACADALAKAPGSWQWALGRQGQRRTAGPACRKALTPPFLQCAKCKAAAYCRNACQVPPTHTHAARCARARASARTDPLLRACPPCSLPPDRCVEGRAQARVRAVEETESVSAYTFTLNFPHCHLPRTRSSPWRGS
jgi:hypothetical protein